MKSYLEGIILLGKDQTKRTVPLQAGVNIITGDSKTGKSALVEIIDYCLCSAHCSVPKGKITEYTLIFAILMRIGDGLYLIARKAPGNGGYMFFTKVDDSYKTKDVSADFIYSLPESSPKEVQYKIESALGMNITNISSPDETSEKPSLRNMVSYLFQHQNLIASKFALFYRFTDFNKRKDVINQFPVFAGLVDQEYYSDLIRLDSLKARLRAKRLAQSRIAKQVDYVNDELLPLLQNHYALLEKPFPELQTSQQIFAAANCLPEFDDAQLFQEDGIIQRYHTLNETLARLKDEKHTVLQRIETLETTETHGDRYQQVLTELQEKTEFSTATLDEYTCPICGSSASDLKKADADIIAAQHWLEHEIVLSKNYAHSFAEDIRKLKEERDILNKRINDTFYQIRQIERKYIKSHDLVTKREKVGYSMSQIKLYLDTSKLSDDSELAQDIAKLEHEIETLKAKIDGYSIDVMLRRAESFFNKNMNSLADSLDFEDEYKPVDLNFTLVDKSFDLYQHQHQRDRIYLYEMGSGANWLSCHMALFLSFLHYFAVQKSSPMPLIMFFDQPSQVYFPQGLTKESKKENDKYSSDLAAIDRIYQTMFDEVKSIQEDAGILPQLIIVDHVDSSIMKNPELFKSALRCDWRDGKKLI